MEVTFRLHQREEISETCKGGDFRLENWHWTKLGELSDWCSLTGRPSYSLESSVVKLLFLRCPMSLSWLLWNTILGIKLSQIKEDHYSVFFFLMTNRFIWGVFWPISLPFLLIYLSYWTENTVRQNVQVSDAIWHPALNLFVAGCSRGLDDDQVPKHHTWMEELNCGKTIWMTHLKAVKTSSRVKLLSGLSAHAAHTGHRIMPNGKSESHF